MPSVRKIRWQWSKILFGKEFVKENTVLYAVSNTNAPLVLDEAMSGSLKVYARNNQAVACTPWTLAGCHEPLYGSRELWRNC